MLRRSFLLLGWMLAGLAATATVGAAQDGRFAAAWPNTDFSKSAVDLDEIISGGPGKDGIPAITAPRFIAASEALGRYAGREPVISLVIDGDARAYPLQVLTWHEIANDEVGGQPVAVTYCPLCNAAIVFDRRVNGRVLTFGVSGLLRWSDMVMYDRETESWWQQYSGEGVVGALTGAALERLPARIEALDAFLARHPEGRVLIPNDPSARPYGRNPYQAYDSARRPFLYSGDLPEHVEPMTYVVVVGDTAWGLERVAREGEVTEGDLRIRKTGEMASALDATHIVKGRPLPSVVVERRGADGDWTEIPYDLTFAFVFHAFEPDGAWRL